MELRKQQEHYHGFADKEQLERHEKISERLEQLAESERQHREQLEREERIRNSRLNYYTTTPPDDSFLATLTNVIILLEFSNYVIIIITS